MTETETKTRATVAGRNRIPARLCRVSSRRGVLTFNTVTMNELEMRKGRRLLLLGGSNGEWRISVADAKDVGTADGFRIKNICNAGYDRPYQAHIYIGHELAAKMLAKASKTPEDDSVRFCVSLNPEEDAEGRKWYRIITAAPYMCGGMFRGE